MTARLVCLAVLLAMGVRLVLPVLGDGLIEAIPGHSHVVVGGTPEEQALALEAHLAGQDHSHHHHAEDEAAAADGVSQAHVVVLIAYDIFASGVAGLSDLVLHTSPWPSLPPLGPHRGQILLPENRIVAVFVPPPDPPPRPS
ncbi:MAG: hypothetical protein U0822_25040 [Anaerolineae bacterium]